MERTTSFGGDSNIGVFARVFEDIAIIPPEAPEQFRSLLAEALDVDLVVTTVQGSPIIGSLVAGNSRGLVVSGLATDREIDLLEEYRPVFLLEHTMNAAGNIILANDRFAAVHPDMPAELAEEVGDALGVPVSRLTLAGIKTVGMAGVATNRGVVVHPRSTDLRDRASREACRSAGWNRIDQYGERTCRHRPSRQQQGVYCRNSDERV